MPTYKITEPQSGKVFRITGDSPPTEQELEQIFSSVGERESPELLAGHAPFGQERFAVSHKPPGPTIPERLWEGTKRGLLGIGKLVSNPYEAAQPLAKALANPESRAEIVRAGIIRPIKESIVNPAGIPGRALDWAIDNPVDTLLIAGPPLLSAARAGRLGGIADVAEALAAGDKYTGKGIIGRIAETGLPEKIYGSAVKTPLTKKWVQTLGPEDASQRMKVLQEGVRERVRPSEYGISKAVALEKESRMAVEKIVNDATARGEATIKTADMADAGLQKSYQVAANSSDPIGAKAVIDQFKETFIAGHGEELTIAKANQVKRQLYNETKWTGNAPTGLSAQLSEVMKKGTAHELMAELETRYPALRFLNEQDAARIGLKEAIERSVARHGNRDLLGLGSKVLTGRSIPMAIWESTAGHPQVKAQLSFALDSARSAARRFNDIPPMDPALVQRAREAGLIGSPGPIPVGQRMQSGIGPGVRNNPLIGGLPAMSRMESGMVPGEVSRIIPGAPLPSPQFRGTGADLIRSLEGQPTPEAMLRQKLMEIEARRISPVEPPPIEPVGLRPPMQTPPQGRPPSVEELMGRRKISPPAEVSTPKGELPSPKEPPPPEPLPVEPKVPKFPQAEPGILETVELGDWIKTGTLRGKIVGEGKIGKKVESWIVDIGGGRIEPVPKGAAELWHKREIK